MVLFSQMNGTQCFCMVLRFLFCVVLVKPSWLLSFPNLPRSRWASFIQVGCMTEFLITSHIPLFLILTLQGISSTFSRTIFLPRNNQAQSCLAHETTRTRYILWAMAIIFSKAFHPMNGPDPPLRLRSLGQWFLNLSHTLESLERFKKIPIPRLIILSQKNAWCRIGS